MGYYVVKIIVTVALVLLVSELSKRSTLLGGFFASLPLVSLLALTWLYAETRDVSRVASLATSILWLVLPSLALFVTLPLFLRGALGFWISLSLSLAVTGICYAVLLYALNNAGIEI